MRAIREVRCITFAILIRSRTLREAYLSDEVSSLWSISSDVGFNVVEPRIAKAAIVHFQCVKTPRLPWKSRRRG